MEAPLQVSVAGVEVAPHGAAADAEQAGDLLGREVGPVGQDEHGPGSQVERVDRGPDLGPHLRVEEVGQQARPGVALLAGRHDAGGSARAGGTR